MEGMGVYGMDTEAGPSFPKGSDVNNFISELVLPNNSSYNLCIGVSTFRKKSLIKNGIYGAENDISLCIAHKVVSIVLISNKYY